MDFGPFGASEILLICALALVLFGPKRLPEIGAAAGRMLTKLKRASNELMRSLESEVEQAGAPLREEGRDVSAAAESVPADLRRDLSVLGDELRSVGREIEDLTSPTRWRSQDGRPSPGPARPPVRPTDREDRGD